MRPQGFTLIELMVSIVVIGMLAAFTTSFYKSNQRDQVIDELIENVLHIKNNIIDEFAVELNYSGLTEEFAIAAGIFPPDIEVDANGKCRLRVGSLRCKVNELITAGMKPDYLDQSAGFQIVIRSVPNPYCFPLVTKLRKYFKFVGFPGTGVIQSHQVSYSEANARSHCFGLDEDGSSDLRVGHY